MTAADFEAVAANGALGPIGASAPISKTINVYSAWYSFSNGTEKVNDQLRERIDGAHLDAGVERHALPFEAKRAIFGGKPGLKAKEVFEPGRKTDEHGPEASANNGLVCAPGRDADDDAATDDGAPLEVVKIVKADEHGPGASAINGLVSASGRDADEDAADDAGAPVEFVDKLIPKAGGGESKVLQKRMADWGTA